MSDFYNIFQYYNEEEDEKAKKLEEFKFPAKKKFSHASQIENYPCSVKDDQYYTIREILEPNKNQNDIFDQNGSQYNTEYSCKEKIKENMQKSITWRSPLVFSPAAKFSPKIKYNISDSETDVQNESNNQTFETISSKSNTNLTLNVQRTPKPSQNINLRYSGKNRGTPFPLRDKDYNGSPNNEPQIDDTFDICSSSFLEKLGLPNNQLKNTPKYKKSIPSPTVNYYSQLLSQPVQAQKHAAHEAQKITEGTKNFDTGTDFSKVRSESILDSSQRVNVNDNRVQDWHILAQNKPVASSNVETDLNKSRVCVPQMPNLVQQNYEDVYYPCYYQNPRENRLDPTQNSHQIDQKFVENRYIPYESLYGYSDFPKVPRMFQNEERVYRQMYGNTSPVLEENFQHRSGFETSLNRSQVFENLQRQRLPRNYQSIERELPSNRQVYRDTHVESFQKYPEMLHRRDCSQQNVFPNESCVPFVQQKSFEEKMNEENDLRSAEMRYSVPVSNRQVLQAPSQNFTQSMGNRHFYPGNVQDGQYFKHPQSSSLETFHYGDIKQENNLGRDLNRSLSFEDVNLAPNPRQIYAQRNDVYSGNQNWQMPEQNLRYRNNFQPQPGSNFNRTYAGPPSRSYRPEQNYGFPAVKEEGEEFPSNNDKEYVMNKFLYSLNRH